MIGGEWVVLNQTLSIVASENNTILRIYAGFHNSTSAEEHHLTCDEIEQDTGHSALIRVNQSIEWLVQY